MSSSRRPHTDQELSANDSSAPRERLLEALEEFEERGRREPGWSDWQSNPACGASVAQSKGLSAKQEIPF